MNFRELRIGDIFHFDDNTHAYRKTEKGCIDVEIIIDGHKYPDGGGVEYNYHPIWDVSPITLLKRSKRRRHRVKTP